jgi:hypothetical protein
MKISINKVKITAMEGKYMMRYDKIVLQGNVSEQTNIFKYLGCNISTYKMNMDVEEKKVTN